MPDLDTRNADATFAAGDVIGFQAPLGTPAPVGFADLGAPWVNMGWIDPTGLTFKLQEAIKEIMAAGTLDPIRTIITGAPKTIDVTFLEPMNPVVRSLLDNVPLSALQPAGSTTVATYTLPDVPADNRYCYCWDTFDDDKRMRTFAPNGKVTTRGNDQQQQLDAETVQMTFTLYPALIGSVRSATQRYIDYGGIDLTPFYS